MFQFHDGSVIHPVEFLQNVKQRHNLLTQIDSMQRYIPDEILVLI